MIKPANVTSIPQESGMLVKMLPIIITVPTIQHATTMSILKAKSSSLTALSNILLFMPLVRIQIMHNSTQFTMFLFHFCFPFFRDLFNCPTCRCNRLTPQLETEPRLLRSIISLCALMKLGRFGL